MVRNALLALFLAACSAQAGELCDDESSSECVQAAFDPGETCAAAAESEELGCSREYDDYLACLDTAIDCGSCDALRRDWNECFADVCSYASRIDEGCFDDRPDCQPVFDEGNTPDNCLPLWRNYIICLARSSPDDASCDDQCIDLFTEFWTCD